MAGTPHQPFTPAEAHDPAVSEDDAGAVVGEGAAEAVRPLPAPLPRAQRWVVGDQLRRREPSRDGVPPRLAHGWYGSGFPVFRFKLDKPRLAQPLAPGVLPLLFRVVLGGFHDDADVLRVPVHPAQPRLVQPPLLVVQRRDTIDRVRSTASWRVDIS
eukprot:gene2213-biopygen10808